MVLWRCNLRVSRYARVGSLSLHGTVILALLLASWPASVGFTLLWAILLPLVLGECWRSQQRIAQCDGDLVLLAGHTVRWRQQHWQMPAPPWISRRAILLPLRNEAGQRERLWLFADAMASRDWRLLRQQLLMNNARDDVP